MQFTTVYADGRTEVRDATPDEIAAYEKAKNEAQLEQEQREAEIQRQKELRASALAKLAALGLTEEEAAAIIK